MVGWVDMRNPTGRANQNSWNDSELSVIVVIPMNFILKFLFILCTYVNAHVGVVVMCMCIGECTRMCLHVDTRGTIHFVFFRLGLTLA